MDPIREKLVQLDQQAAQFQSQNKYLEALAVFEEMLNIKKGAYGEDSEEYFKTSDKLCELCNLISMIFLSKEKFDASLEFLKKADLLAQSSSHYKAITYNNLACYYRRSGKLRSALQYLQQALEIEVKSTSQSLADTHLNMCAVLSQLNRHQEALEHALISVVLLQDEFLMLNQQQKTKEKDNQKEKQNEKQNDKQNEKERDDRQSDRISVLAIAYHNLGVEFEYLKRFDEAIQTYQKAVRFAQANLPQNHMIIDNLTNVLNNAQEQILSMRQKDVKRRQQKDVQSRAQVKRKIDKVQNIYQEKKQVTKTNFNPRGGQEEHEEPKEQVHDSSFNNEDPTHQEQENL